MITLYGSPMSRARRCLWLLEELGLAYRSVPVAPRSEAASGAEYRALNALGKVPTLVDGELTLTESLAINFYLARRYGGSWWPQNTEDEARLMQWAFFGATEIDPLFFSIIYERLLKPDAARIEAAAAQAEQMLARPLGLLDQRLAEQPYLFGPQFTLADLNVAGVCTMGRRVKFDFSIYLNARAWLDRCWSRPAFLKVDAMS